MCDGYLNYMQIYIVLRKPWNTYISGRNYRSANDWQTRNKGKHSTACTIMCYDLEHFRADFVHPLRENTSN